MDIFNEIFNTDCYKDYTAVRGIQNVYTPIDKIEEVTEFEFNSLIDSSTKEVGVLFNFEFIENLLKKVNKDYINNIHITFFYDSNFDLNEAKFIAACNNFNNITFESIKDFSNSKSIKDLDKVMAGKKFDIVFSNPPYNNNIDLRILNSIFNIANNIVFVHPSTFILDKKFKEKIYKEVRNTNFLENIYLFWENNLFNIQLFVPLCISIWNTKKENNDVKVNDYAISNKTYFTKINDVYYHHGPVLEKFLDIIKMYENNNFLTNRTKYDYSNITDFSITFPVLRGGACKSGIYKSNMTMICKNYEENCVDSNFNYGFENENNYQKWSRLFSFYSEKERMNFINYCKTKFARFCLSLIKIGQHLDRGELKFIPWLDFTQEWNDAKLCKEFGISKELWNYIDNFIPDYYDDYECGF